MKTAFAVALKWALAALLSGAGAIAIAATSPTAHQQQTAWLLIGFSEFTGRPYYQLENGESREQQVERIFSTWLSGLPLHLEVRERATQEDLFTALHDPTSVVVAWMGHSRDVNEGLLAPTGVVRDARGDNVVSLFREIHPNLRWLIVIGCEIHHFFEDATAQEFYRANRQLTIVDYNDLIEPSLGLIQGLQILRKNWQPVEAPLCRETYNFAVPLEITRDLDDNRHAPAVQVLMNGRVLAVFAPQRGGRQTQQAWLTDFDISPDVSHDIEIVSAAKAPGKHQEDLGSFTITGEALQWQPIKSRRGEAMGRSRRVYILNQDLVLPRSIPRRPAC
jgi:hypothetical protein